MFSHSSIDYWRRLTAEQTLVGKYEEWHTHMNGLAGVITSTEQLRALPHLVQVHAQK